MTDAIAERACRAALPWRIAFALYAIALTIGTHWPRLDMQIAGERAPDKIIHMFAFGGLMFLLWRTRWFGDGILLLAIGLTWALLDELTQGLPGLGRTVSALDLAANWSGIVLVFAGIRALRPIGGPINRMRQQMTEFVIDELFMRWRTWLLVIVGGLAMASIVGGAATIIMWSVHPDGTMYAAFISIAAGGLGGAHLMLDLLWRRERRNIAEAQRCLVCGESCAEVEIDEHGIGACPSCHSPLHIGQWHQRTALSRITLLRLAVGPAILAISLSILAVLIFVSGLALYMHFPMELQPLRRIGRITMDMRLVFDMVVIGVIVSIAVYRFRKAMARVIDGQANRCRACRHDVHATGDERGIGRCPECGTHFIRLDEQADRTLRDTYSAPAR